MAKYLAELERLWRQNRKGEFAQLFEFPPDAKLQRPKTLRGPDLVNELLRLRAITKDKRFEDAIRALIEHRIVGRNFNFTRLDLLSDERIERGACAAIHQVKSLSRMSLRRACADLAAHLGWPATSFAAATKHLELLYRLHPEWRGTIVELEKSCSTKIPTTADN